MLLDRNQIKITNVYINTCIHQVTSPWYSCSQNTGLVACRQAAFAVTACSTHHLANLTSQSCRASLKTPRTHLNKHIHHLDSWQLRNGTKTHTKTAVKSNNILPPRAVGHPEPSKHLHPTLYYLSKPSTNLHMIPFCGWYACHVIVLEWFTVYASSLKCAHQPLLQLLLVLYCTFLKADCCAN